MPSSLLLVSSFGPSLLNFRGHLLRQALQSGFDQVIVLSPECDRDHPSLDILRSWGVDVRFFPLQRTGLNPFYDLYTIYKLYRVISHISPSHLVAYTIKPVLYCGLVVNLFKYFFVCSQAYMKYA